MAGLLLASALVFRAASQSPLPVDRAQVEPSAGVLEDPDVLIKADLNLLRARLAKGRHLRYRVDYSGAEFRVAKYFIAKLNPAACQEIAEVYIETLSSARGFTVSVQCLSKLVHQPRLTVLWRGNQAIGQMEGQPGSHSVELFTSQAGSRSNGETVDQ